MLSPSSFGIASLTPSPKFPIESMGAGINEGEPAFIERQAFLWHEGYQELPQL